MTLWPQAWPTSGSASYSARAPRSAGPGPKRPRTAVSSPPTPALDVKTGLLEPVGDPAAWPCFLVAELGLAWIQWLSPISASCARSTRSRASSLVVGRVVTSSRRGMVGEPGFEPGTGRI